MLSPHNDINGLRRDILTRYRELDTSHADTLFEAHLDTIMDFFTSNKKVLLLLTDAAVSSEVYDSLLIKLLVTLSTDESFSETLPLYYPLSNMEEPYNQLIENVFTHNELDMDTPTKSIDNGIHYFLLLSHYEQMLPPNKLINLYTKNDLDRYPIQKIIITCNATKLEKCTHYHLYFTSYHNKRAEKKRLKILNLTQQRHLTPVIRPSNTSVEREHWQSLLISESVQNIPLIRTPEQLENSYLNLYPISPNHADTGMKVDLLKSKNANDGRSDAFLLKQTCFLLLRYSKHRPGFEIGSANAISLLIYSKFCFSGFNLSGIKIPNADLHMLVADGANFDKADLSNCYLGRASLVKASFNEAICGHLNIGEQIYFGQDGNNSPSAYVFQTRFNLGDGNTTTLEQVPELQNNDILQASKHAFHKIRFHPLEENKIFALDIISDKLYICDLDTGKKVILPILLQYGCLKIDTFEVHEQNRLLIICGSIKSSNPLFSDLFLAGHDLRDYQPKFFLRLKENAFPTQTSGLAIDQSGEIILVKYPNELFMVILEEDRTRCRTIPVPDQSTRLISNPALPKCFVLSVQEAVYCFQPFTSGELFTHICDIDIFVLTLVINPAGDLLALAGRNRDRDRDRHRGNVNIRLCNLSNLNSDVNVSNHTDIITQHEGAIYSLCFHPNENWLVSGGEMDNMVFIWDVTSQTKIGEIVAHTRFAWDFGIYTLAFNKHGDLLSSGGGDNSLRTVEFNQHRFNKKQTSNINPISDSRNISTFTISNNNELIAHIKRNSITILSVSTGQALYAHEIEDSDVLAHDQLGLTTSAAFNTTLDTLYLATASHDQMTCNIHIWHFKEASLNQHQIVTDRQIISVKINPVTFTLLLTVITNEQQFSSFEHRQFNLNELTQYENPIKDNYLGRPGAAIPHVKFISQRDWLIVSYQPVGLIRLFSLRTGEILQSIKSDEPIVCAAHPQKNELVLIYKKQLTSSFDSKIAFIAITDEGKNHEPIHTITNAMLDSSGVFDLEISHDGCYLVVAFIERCCEVFDISDISQTRKIAVLKNFRGLVKNILFVSSNQFLCYSTDNSIKIWRIYSDDDGNAHVYLTWTNQPQLNLTETIFNTSINLPPYIQAIAKQHNLQFESTQEATPNPITKNLLRGDPGIWLSRYIYPGQHPYAIFAFKLVEAFRLLFHAYLRQDSSAVVTMLQGTGIDLFLNRVARADNPSMPPNTIVTDNNFTYNQKIIDLLLNDYGIEGAYFLDINKLSHGLGALNECLTNIRPIISRGISTALLFDMSIFSTNRVKPYYMALFFDATEREQDPNNLFQQVMGFDGGPLLIEAIVAHYRNEAYRYDEADSMQLRSRHQDLLRQRIVTINNENSSHFAPWSTRQSEINLKIALSLCEQALPENDIDTAKTLNHLGQILATANIYEKLYYFQKALSILNNHPDTRSLEANIYYNIGLSYAKILGYYGIALKYLNMAVEHSAEDEQTDRYVKSLNHHRNSIHALRMLIDELKIGLNTDCAANYPPEYFPINDRPLDETFSDLRAFCEHTVINRLHTSPLIEAIESRHYELVAYLLRQGIDPNQNIPEEHTPLRQAVALGEGRIVRLLFEHGAEQDPTLLDEITLLLAEQSEEDESESTLQESEEEENTNPPETRQNRDLYRGNNLNTFFARTPTNIAFSRSLQLGAMSNYRP